MTPLDAAEIVALAEKAIAPGDWVIVRVPPLYGGKRDTYEAGQVEKVTPKQIHVKVGYKSQHSKNDVVRMPDEAAARLFEQRAKSAWAEAVRREYAAWDSYRSKVAKMIRASLLSDHREG